MRFLITGGAGFVGSHLAEELLRRGHVVHVLDDLSTGSMANIAHLRWAERFEYTIDSADNDRVVAEAVSGSATITLAAAIRARFQYRGGVAGQLAHQFGQDGDHQTGVRREHRHAWQIPT